MKPAATAEQVAELEANLRRDLPEDSNTYLMTTNGYARTENGPIKERRSHWGKTYPCRSTHTWTSTYSTIFPTSTLIPTTCARTSSLVCSVKRRDSHLREQIQATDYTWINPESGVDVARRRVQQVVAKADKRSREKIDQAIVDQSGSR